ncbi:hypothetical protein Y032_0569g85 [Ancylostoma ceylanicum]|uniref:Uncharacterized protein n=1 Tax=Ancylostoma ceylanicum TaxID=53326 RepID=A0A016WNQ3_9BILA|nr:hypothetical protein Y032_0569g85 [Ancylostoma ceylanicum]
MAQNTSLLQRNKPENVLQELMPPVCIGLENESQVTHIPVIIFVIKSVSDGLIRRKPSESLGMDQNDSSYHHSKALKLVSLNIYIKILFDIKLTRTKWSPLIT